MLEYDWVDAKVSGTSLALSIEAAIDTTGIVVGDPLEWSALLVIGKRGYAILLMIA